MMPGASASLGLLLAKAPKYPKVPPEVSSEIGWLVFALVLCTLYWVWTRSASVRRSLLALEDPRAYAVLRIGFALMTIQCFWNLAPYWRMLWSDEGIFSLYEARQRLGRTALQGWTPDEGFFDIFAVMRFFWAKHSAFFFWGSPAFVEGYMYTFFGVLTLYALGVCTRVTGVISWLMMSGIYNRNALYLEGTDTVYRTFWFILLFAKTGHAWSVDNWIRCWWLRRRGRLLDPRGPPEGEVEEDEQGQDPKSKMRPIYRLVPAWPRYLMMAQLCALYMTTGLVKTGSVWAKGDAFYFALNMDHFYRFEVWTQMVSSIFATNVFRVMTWVTHWWEMCFPILGIGMMLKFGLEHRDKPWYRGQRRFLRLWSGRLALLGGYILVYRINAVAFPFCVKQDKNIPDDVMANRVARGLYNIDVTYMAIVPAALLLWYVVGRWPLRPRVPGFVRRALGRIPVPAKVSALAAKLPRPGPWVIDQGWLRRWLLGRRLWLTCGFFFHGALILFMNIGMFPFIMLMTYAAWVTGDEYARMGSGFLNVLRRVGARFQKRPRARALFDWIERRGRPLTAPAQRAIDVPRRGRPVPDLVVALFCLTAVALLYMRIEKIEGIRDYVEHYVAAAVGVGLVCRLLPPRARPGTRAALGGGPALSYTSIGRTLALFATLWHGGSVLMTVFPSYPVFSSFRGRARGFFQGWASGTATSQSWRMFAPNPPRSNSFMKTVVVDEDGWRWDLNNNSFSYRPFPWIWNDRMRKMQRRMIGKGKWYLKYWTEFQCRDWFLRTGGEPRAQRIEIYKIHTRIPTPEQVSRKGWYRPRDIKHTEKLVEKHKCSDYGELPLFMKERYGYEIFEFDRERARKLEESEARRFKNRRKSWENRRNFFGNKPDRARKKKSIVTPPTRVSPAAVGVEATEVDEQGD